MLMFGISQYVEFDLKDCNHFLMGMFISTYYYSTRLVIFSIITYQFNIIVVINFIFVSHIGLNNKQNVCNNPRYEHNGSRTLL
jgi:hypothetical protein